MLHDVVDVWPGSCNNVTPGHALLRFSIPDMSQQGDQTHSTCCAQQCCHMLYWNAVIVWPELANAGPTMLPYVLLICCDRLAGSLKSNNIDVNGILYWSWGQNALLRSFEFKMGFWSAVFSWPVIKRSFVLQFTASGHKLTGTQFDTGNCSQN